MSSKSPESSKSAVKRNADESGSETDSKRNKSDEREVNVDPIHDTAFGLCLQARTFLVGPKAEPFVIHRNLLRQRCGKYWESLHEAVKNNPSLMKHYSHRLPEEDPRTFAMFVAWLYTGEIPPSPDDEDGWNIPPQLRLVSGQASEYERWYDEDLVDLWVFAATNQIYDLSNAAVSSLAMQNGQYTRTTTRAALATAFEYTGRATGLQKYLIDEALYRLDTSAVPKSTSHYPVEYVSRILEEVMSRKTGGGKVAKPRWQKKPCLYHNHADSASVKRKCRNFWLGSPSPRYDEEIYDLLEDTVTLIVGASKIPFVVHRGLLCKYSPFFHGLFHGNFKEANRGRVELDTDNVRDFILFLSWLYSEKVQTPSPKVNLLIERYLSAQDRSLTLWTAPPSSDDSGFEDMGDADAEHEVEDEDTAMDAPNSSATTVIAEVVVNGKQVIALPEIPDDHDAAIDDATRMHQIQQDLISLFIFAEHRNVPHLRNDIMNRIVELRSKRWPLLTIDPAVIHRCYSSLEENSDLCTYLEEEAAFCWNSNDHAWLLDGAVNLPPAFLGNVLGEIFRERLDTDEERRPSWCADVCYFHFHVDDEEEMKCRRGLKKWQEELSMSDYAAVDAPELEW
ncbi:hypothetical protein M409DRAFT_29559 [Zasmidium cellare ATCC 36951]|uniref:BTB domain-containing protein n=1 Tax=Zasmidium cellare ATCC 36951 TaxID=1080233 RepID=A0A6A6C1C2_ZASCE|nr:uncharacterized protein M409DRAFT_29559 [Zasmidium cellare ATCC 36951]KAF2159950.1 hypothetical protein M409DRAFT_29559 [Zasmidium cellare ATCC 36951]